MATVVNMHEAKTNLSRLVKQVEAGEEVVIARDGQPVARLSRIVPKKRKLQFETLKGQIKMLEGFDDPIEGWEEYF